MLNLLFRLLLTFNSLSAFLIVYVVKAHIWIPKLSIYSLIVYLSIPVIISFLCLKLSHFLSHDSIEAVRNIEVGSESFAAVYLGYFFVAAGIPDNDIVVLLFVFIMLFLFTFFSQAQYFNPVFLLFGFKFYGITKTNGVKIFVISRKKLRGTEGLRFRDLRRINDFTYIDVDEG